MSLKKRIFKHPLFQRTIVGIIYWYSVLVHKTSHWQCLGYEEVQQVVCSDCPVIVVMWHGRILLSPKFPLLPKKHYAVISLHGDGVYVADYMERHNVTAVRGSSKKGAMAAFREALKILKEGHLLVVTPDGPRGPAMVLGGNVIGLAKMTGAAIIPYSQSTSHGVFLRTWDRFRIPFPFSKGVYMYGKPVWIEKNATEEEMKIAEIELQKRLNIITRQSDEYVGITSVV